MNWIVISRSCNECGGDIAFQIFEKEPTEEDIQKVNNSLGGMFCIKEYVTEIRTGINEIENKEY